VGRVKKKEHEKLNDANLQHVITLLNPKDKSKKPITKKEACSILNISYNTVRLKKIIDEFLEKQAFVLRRKSENRGKRATEAEILQIIYEYLEGEPVSSIAKTLFRSAGFVKAIVQRVGIPQRALGDDKHKIAFLPEQCISEKFSEGEVVWSAKYHAPAIVVRELNDPKYKNDYKARCYQISVIEKVDASESYFKHIEAGGFNAFCLAYDLGSLQHLKEYGVDLKKIS